MPTIKIDSVKLPEEGRTVIVQYRATFKDKEASVASPTSLVGIVLADVEINEFVKKDKKKAKDQPRKKSRALTLLADDDGAENVEEPEVVAGPPLLLRAFEGAVFFKFFDTYKPLPKLVPGCIYEFRGVTYSIWHEGNDRVSFKVEQCVPVDRVLTYDAIPVEHRLIQEERDLPCIGQQYDKNKPGALFAMQLDNVHWAMELNTMYCKVQLPDDNDKYWYFRPPKEKGGPEELALTSGLNDDGTQRLSPIFDAVAVYADGNTQKYAIRYGGYQDDFYALHLDVHDWKILAPYLLSKAKGIVVGVVNREGTEGMIAPPGYSGALSAYCTLCLDVPTMIRRSGVHVRHPGPLLPESKHPNWSTSLLALDRNAKAINLKNYNGDPTSMTGEYWIVCNHGLDSVDAINALDIDQRLDCLLGKGPINMKLPDKPVFACYLVLGE